jgi:hypothetical protein
VYLDERSAALADLLADHFRALPGQVGKVTRSAVLQAGLEALAREQGLDEAEIQAELDRRLAPG